MCQMMHSHFFMCGFWHSPLSNLNEARSFLYGTYIEKWKNMPHFFVPSHGTYIPRFGTYIPRLGIYVPRRGIKKYCVC